MKANPAKDKAGLQAIEDGRIIVDIEAGIITKPDGSRAETPTKQAYGIVYVGQGYQVLAHRLVWMAVHGLIPEGMTINHKNTRRWDNRIANLEILSQGDNTRHAGAIRGNTTRFEGHGSVVIRMRRTTRPQGWRIQLDMAT